MIYLVLAILSSTMVSFIMKLSTNRIHYKIGMLAVNYLMCLLIAASTTQRVFPSHSGLPLTLGLGTIHGILYLSSFALLQSSVSKNGVVLSATFMKLGLLVPMVISIFLFKEIPSAIQILGFTIAIIGIVLVNQEEQKSTLKINASLLLLLVLGGSGDAMSKVYEEIGSAELASQFLLYTFVVAFILCLVLMLKKHERFGIEEIKYGLLIGIPNYYSAFFLLQSLKSIHAVIVYPTYSVATLLLVTMSGVWIFKESLTKKQWLAMGIIVIALALLNL